MAITRRARFQYIGIGQDSMQRVAEATRLSVLARIQRGQTVEDAPARPLQMKYRVKWKEHKLQKLGADRGYRAQKMRKGGKPIRDWTLTGHTLASMRVMFVSATQAVIGFLNGFGPNRKITAGQIAAIRNRDERQFGMAPSDRRNMLAALFDELKRRPPVRTTSTGESSLPKAA